MLVLTRKLGESIAIDDHIKIRVVQIKGKQVRLGIEAPRDTKIHREEVKAYAHRREDMERTLQTIERRIQASHITEQRLQDAIDGAQRKLLNSRDELKHLEAQREELRASEEMVAEQRNAANSSIEKFSRILSESVDGANVSNLAEIGGLMEQVVEVAVHAARREPTIMQEDSAKSKTKTHPATNSAASCLDLQMLYHRVAGKTTLYVETIHSNKAMSMCLCMQLAHC